MLNPWAFLLAFSLRHYCIRCIGSPHLRLPASLVPLFAHSFMFLLTLPSVKRFPCSIAWSALQCTCLQSAPNMFLFMWRFFAESSNNNQFTPQLILTFRYIYASICHVLSAQTAQIFPDFTILQWVYVYVCVFDSSVCSLVNHQLD